MNYDAKIEKMKSTNNMLWFFGPLFTIIFIITFIVLIAKSNTQSETNLILPIIVELMAIIFAFYTIYQNKLKIEEMTVLRNEQIKLDTENDLTEVIPQLSLNEKSKKLRINNSIYSFKDIIGCEIIEDGEVITTTTEKKKAAIGKAIVGGAIFGPAGAIIGGTSGKSVSRSMNSAFCNKLDLKITVNNLNNPVEYIKMIDGNISKQSNEYKTSSEEAQKCLSIMQIVINRG